MCISTHYVYIYTHVYIQLIRLLYNQNQHNIVKAIILQLKILKIEIKHETISVVNRYLT